MSKLEIGCKQGVKLHADQCSIKYYFTFVVV
jgi:hypothetical protein